MKQGGRQSDDLSIGRGIDDPADIHFVQVKCPLLTVQRIEEAEGRSAAVATRDTLKSMGLSRAASALGVAAALGEIAAQKMTATVKEAVSKEEAENIKKKFEDAGAKVTIK